MSASAHVRVGVQARGSARLEMLRTFILFSHITTGIRRMSLRAMPAHVPNDATGAFVKCRQKSASEMLWRRAQMSHSLGRTTYCSDGGMSSGRNSRRVAAFVVSGWIGVCQHAVNGWTCHCPGRRISVLRCGHLGLY